MDKMHVAMDESDASLRALALGQHLARQLAVPLCVTSVVAGEERAEARRAALQSRLADQQTGDVTIKVAVHESAKAYLGQLAGRDDVGLCMMAHGRRPVPEMLIGSVTAGVVRRANRPVFLCGPRYAPERHARVETLMVCVDGSALSEAILPHAVALAERFAARLQLLQVIEAIGDLPEGSQHGDVMESSYLHGLARRLARDHGIQADWEVLHGDPADAIVSYLHDGENTLLAMTTHGRSGLSQVVAGSVTHEVVHEAPCPVAVWRPRD